MDKSKIMGIATALMCLFMLVGPASAATQASVTTSATIPGVMGISVDKTALTFNLASTGSWTNPNEGAGGVAVTNTGNVAANLMAKLGAENQAGLETMFNGKILTTSDVQNEAGIMASQTKAMSTKMRTNTGMPAGVFNNTIVLTMVAA